MLPANPPPVKPTGPESPRDPRVTAFSRLVAASDRADIKSTVAAVRELHGLGWSVCAVTPARKGGL